MTCLTMLACGSGLAQGSAPALSQRGNIRSTDRYRTLLNEALPETNIALTSRKGLEDQLPMLPVEMAT